jgi:transcriptional regulator with GAF, ATPase, and Fis domain
MAGRKSVEPQVVGSDATVSSERSRVHARTAMPTAHVVAVYPRAVAQVHVLREATTIFGRQSGAPALHQLDHPTVSRQHLELTWDATVGRHSVVDLGSRNGTWLEGQPVATALPRFLRHGDVLRIGDVIAVYECGAAPEDAAEVDLEALPGQSLAARHLRAAVLRAATDRAPALILGETGAGKENVAAEVHRLSGRRGPLVTINCAALSPQIVESQLFGHARGAFTGATQEHAGVFRAASGGTLFLDEIGEMPLELQPKLLRAVELGEVVPLGSTQPLRVDVRLIAATNRPLEHEIAAGRFRRDLYARLARWELHAPPLRERRADIFAWIERLHRIAAPEGEPQQFTAEAAEALLLAPWPDNLRGVQRFVHACGRAGDKLEREQLPRWLGDTSTGGSPGAAPREPAPRQGFRPRPSRDELVAVLTTNQWSLRATARHYERDRKQIVRWVEMYAIEIPGRVQP